MSRWIKIEVSTPDKGELLAAAEQCHCSQGDAFLAFFRLYSWLDEQTTDGFLPHYTPRMIDARACLAGFGLALAGVGWLSFNAAGCTVTNWCRHNGSCAKRRAQEAKRLNSLRDAKLMAGLPVRPLPMPIV